MESLFFNIFTIIGIILLLIAFFKNKPILGIFAGIIFMMLGLFSWTGVEINTGNTLITNFTYNNTGSVTSQILSNTDVFTTKKDVTVGMVYVLLGLAFLLTSVLEIYNQVAGVKLPDDEED